MENGTRLDTTEKKYDALPYHIKEFAGLPMRFFNLSHDFQVLFEALLENEYKTEKELDIEEQLGYIVDIAEEMTQITSAILHRYNGVGK